MKGRATGTYLSVGTAAALAAVFLCWRPAAAEAAYPANRASRAFSDKVWSRLRGAWRGAAAQAENVRLRREAASLAVLRGDVERLEAENARLRAALGYAEREPGRWVAAAVLSRGGAAAVGDRIRAGKGSIDGVKPGATVVVPEGLVGRVASVSPHTCEIALATDGTVKAAIEAETGGAPLRGILCGGGEVLVARHLTGGGDPPPRARVTTSGAGGVFPRGIEVGSILSVSSGDGGLSRTAEILPSVDYEALEDVFIRL